MDGHDPPLIRSDHVGRLLRCHRRGESIVRKGTKFAHFKVRILLDFSADCNRQDQYGRSSLHYAVYVLNEQTDELMNDWGMCFSKYYHAPVVQLLLEKGADPNLAGENRKKMGKRPKRKAKVKIILRFQRFNARVGRMREWGRENIGICAGTGRGDKREVQGQKI